MNSEKLSLLSALYLLKKGRVYSADKFKETKFRREIFKYRKLDRKTALDLVIEKYHKDNILFMIQELNVADIPDNVKQEICSLLSYVLNKNSSLNIVEGLNHLVSNDIKLLNEFLSKEEEMNDKLEKLLFEYEKQKGLLEDQIERTE